MRETERIVQEYERRAAEGDDERYALTDRANLFLYQRRERALLEMLAGHGLTPLGDKRVLDVGCGNGSVLRDFVRYGARPELLAGIDLLPERVAAAHELSPNLDVREGDGSSLPFDDASFDIALQFTLLSSVLDATMRRAIAGETLRVLRPGGAVVVYDFVWNPLNRATRGVGPRVLAPLYAGCRLDVRRVTLAPPISRRVARFSWTVAGALEAIPPLRSHLLAVVRKP
jgi:SAM-dependent methyltransferase